MKLLIIVIVIVSGLIFTNCSGEKPKQFRFSKEEIASLDLGSTQEIRLLLDSIITFDLNPLLKDRNFDFGGKIKSIKFMPLETNTESLISDIEQVIVADSNIYICTDHMLNSVFIFDINGKYISKIQKGQGPADILLLKGISYDYTKNELIVYHSNYLSFFTNNGKFKRKEKIPLGAYGFILTPDAYLFQAEHRVDNSHLGFSEKYQILITDKSFSLKTKSFPYRFSMDNNYGGSFINAINDTTNITIHFNFVDTIFQYVDNHTVKAKYYFDIKDKSIPERILVDASAREFWSAIEQNDYYYFTGEFNETDTHLSISYYNRFIRKRSEFFIDKGTNNIIGGTGLEYQTKDFPGLSSPIAAKGRYFISYLQPYDIIDKLKMLDNPMISNDDIIRLNELVEDDNPVLIFYELKEF